LGPLLLAATFGFSPLHQPPAIINHQLLCCVTPPQPQQHDYSHLPLHCSILALSLLITVMISVMIVPHLQSAAPLTTPSHQQQQLI
jgi:hypothetical protein